jgi:S-adenosylmethionine:tRNA ribosyltransferase-isomerase
MAANLSKPLQTEDFFYSLPDERIAHTPSLERDQSKLLVVDRRTQNLTAHIFHDFPALLSPGDLVVLNNTRVLPVRLFGKKPTGGEVEILLIRPQHGSANSPAPLSPTDDSQPWEALTRPGLKPGQTVDIGNGELSFTCLDAPAEGYSRLLSPSLSGAELITALKTYGTLPTPPYIKEFTGDPERYQTIFGTQEGSAAAPTASLHFTQRTFEDLQARGINIAYVTLHVGLGTFLPVKVADVTQHHMHAEWCEVSAETAQKIAQTKAAGKRVVAVGTTVARTLETSHGSEFSGDTRLFVYPPHQFKVVDALMTNFHLPESTLLMLVSAFASAPQPHCLEFTTFAENLIGKAYTHAIENEYRFFSFGDGMLIL